MFFSLSNFDMIEDIPALCLCAGRMPCIFSIAYGSAKFALEGFFQGLRSELEFKGVNVSITIFPLATIG